MQFDIAYAETQGLSCLSAFFYQMPHCLPGCQTTRDTWNSADDASSTCSTNCSRTYVDVFLARSQVLIGKHA